MAMVYVLFLFCLLCNNFATAFDVVGWFVGQDSPSWPLSSFDWSTYTTIRVGSVKVLPNGTAVVTLSWMFFPVFGASRA